MVTHINYRVQEDSLRGLDSYQKMKTVDDKEIILLSKQLREVVLIWGKC